MKTINIEGYKGLKIVNCAGTATIKLHSKEALGHSKGASESLKVKATDFEMNEEYKQRAIAFYNSKSQAYWTKFLSAEDLEKMNELQRLYDKKMTRFKKAAKISAFAELEEMFA